MAQSSPKKSKLLKRASTLSIVKKGNVSPSEEEFHEIADNEVIVEDIESSVEKSEAAKDDSPKHGWEKIAKTVNLSAALNALAPPLEEGGTLELSAEDFRVGVPYRFKVHLEQLPGKTLVVTCDPQDGASIKIATHEKEGNVTFMCILVPLKEGKFTISTLFGKKNVLGSPFDVTFNPPADASLCTMEEAPAGCRTSVDPNTLTFCIRTNQEREGLLTATAKSLAGKKSVPVNVTESGKGHYDVEFDATDGKKYRLSVKFDNQHINGSPFLLNLSDASVCQATGEGVVRGVVGQENHFEVATKGAGPGKLRVKVEGKSQTVVIIKPKEDDCYDVTYFPKKVGSYSVTVMWLDEEIPGSPFLVNCYKPVTVTAPKPEKTSMYMVGEMYKFKVDAKESGEGELEANAVEEDSAQVDITSLGKGQYRVDVTPKNSGTTNVSICWAGREVPGSPFPMEADFKPDSSNITTSGPVFEVGSSKPVTMELNAEKAGAGKLKAQCTGEKSKNVPVKIVESQSKVYLISFEPPKPDVYTLWVTWSKKQVPGSPFTINLHPSTAHNCHLIGPPVIPEDLQEAAVLTVSTLGAGNGKLEARAEGEKSGTLADEHIQLIENHAGEMEIKLMAPSPDIYRISVSWSGEEIPKSPFTINCIPPNAEKCAASVSRFGHLSWKDDVFVYVDAADAGNGRLTALAVGDTSGDVSKHISITPDENQLGHYVVKFTPNEPDMYTFTVEWSGTPVPGFPCQLNRNRNQPDAVEVFEPPAGLMQVGQDISIGVDATKGGPGKLSSSCSAKTEEDVPVIVERLEDGYKYKVNFTPPAKDIYSLSVFWTGKHIKGSPFTIDLVPVDASLVVASEPTHPQGLEGPVELTLSTDDAGRAPVIALCMGGKSGRVPVTVKQTSYSRFKLSFTPPQPDLFTMGVKYGNQNINSSPFHINTYPSDASKVIVTAPEEVSIGQSLSYLCDASNAGYGKLSATVSGKKCGKVDANITQNGVAKFTVSFVPQEQDIYSTSIKWEGKEVPASPFSVNLLPLDPSLVKVESVHIPDEAGSEYAYVIIDCSEVGEAPLITSVLGNTTGDVPTETEELANSRQKIKFIPPQDDIYTASVLFNNGDIPGSPFVMSIVSPQPDKVKHISTTIPNQLLPLVELTFDTSEAGRGKMQASTRGQKTGEVNNHEVSESTSGTWKVSFIPPFPDTYDMSCFWAKREIPSSPFKVNLESGIAVKVVVGELHVPAEAGSGEEVWLDLDCSAAGHDVMRGTFEDTATFGSSQEADIKCLGLKLYRLKFEPKEPRLYNFTVRYGRDHVLGSPFEIDLQLCNPEGVKVKEKSLPQYSDGTEGYILVNTSEAGRGKLTAKLSAKTKHHNIPLKFQEEGRKNCKIIFTPPSPGYYTLKIFWSDVPIPSSPHQFTVLQPISPDKVVCGELIGYAPGKPAKMDVSTYGAGRAKLTATCEGEKCGSVDVKVETSETDEDSHIVSFTPPMEDKYSLSVRYCGTVVPGSPFSLDLMLDPLKCFLFDSNDLDQPIHVDQEVTFGVNTTKGGAGKLNVSVITPDDKPAPFLDVTRPNPGLHYVSYTPTTVGLHQINLEWGAGVIPGSPLHLNVQDPAVPIYHNGKPITIQLKKVQGPLSELRATATHVRSNTNFDVVFNRVRKGEFMLVFEADKPGMYRVNIYQSDVEIEGSPYFVRYAAPANPSACVVSSSTSCTHIGETIELTLDASKAGFGEISVHPIVPHSGLDSTVNIRDRRDGSYLIQYTPQAVGQHRIHVMWSDKDVPGSPLPLTVEREENGEGIAQLAEGEWTLFQEPHATDKPLTFVIETPGGRSGKLAVSCYGPGKPELKVEEKKNRSYACRLMSTEPGNYWIHVLWKQRHIEGSPFLLTIIPKKASKVLGLKAVADSQHISSIHIPEKDQCVFQGPQPVGTEVSFRLVTGNAGDGELRVSSAGPGSAEVDLHDNYDGTHTCTLKVSEPGVYKIYVLWEKIHVTGSPFSITFLPSKAVQILGLNACSGPGQVSSVTIVEEDKALFSQPQPLKPLQFSIHTSAGGKGELCVSAKGPGDISVEMLESKTEGVQTCLISPSAPGEYSVYVLWDKIHIHGSPFTINFRPNKTQKSSGGYSSNRDLPSRVHVIPEDLKIFSKAHSLAHPVNFHVSTKKAGKGVLTLTTQGPGKPEVRIGDMKNNICVCTFRASIAGMYKVHLLWNNEHIDENQYELVFNTKERQVVGIDLKNAVLPLNLTHKFKVFYDEVGEGKLNMFCRPTKAAEVKVTPLSSEGYYHCELTPLLPGNHDLVIQYNDMDILGSPFWVHFETAPRPLILPTPPIPHNIRVSGPGISGGVIGQEGNFEIDTSHAGTAKLDFEVVGPKGGFNAQLRQHWEENRLLLARYDPTIPGEYRLIMRWAEIEIPGSPFTVQINEQS